MFFNSQTETEQNHIVSAFIFELSMVETLAVRKRMVEQLANVDEMIAQRVAKGLELKGPLAAMPTTVKIRTNLAASPILSIVKKMKPGLSTMFVPFSKGRLETLHRTFLLR